MPTSFGSATLIRRILWSCPKVRSRPVAFASVCGHSRSLDASGSEAPTLEPIQQTNCIEPPVLYRFDIDLIHEELRIQKHQKMTAVEKQLRRKLSPRLISRAKRPDATIRRTRILHTFEAKLAAVNLTLERLQESKESEFSKEQFHRLLTDKGKRLLERPFREETGGYN